MKKMLMAALVALIMVPANAEEGKPAQDEQDIQYLQRTGGKVLKPGTRQGYIVVINGQSRVTTPELQSTINRIQEVLNLNVEVKDGAPATIATAKAAREAEKANAAVFIVDNPELPMSLIAYEERWGIVNVAKLEDAKANKVRMFGRTRNEMVRVLAMVCGACESQFPSSVLNVGTRPGDLDMASADLPYDVMNRMMSSLKKSGVTPAVYSTYKRACKEGWAPEPENEYQRVIWEKIKAEQSEKPSNPLTIKPGDKPKGK